MLDGLEAEVHLAVDVMLPSARLGALAARVQPRHFRPSRSRLSVEAMGAVTGLVLDRHAVLGDQRTARGRKRRNRAGRGRIGRNDPGRGARPPAGPSGEVDARSRARLYPAGADRPLAPDRRTRFRRLEPAHLASGRSQRQARPAARRSRLGQHAPRHGRGRSRFGRAGAAGHAGLSRRRLFAFGDLSSRYAAGPGRVLAFAAICRLRRGDKGSDIGSGGVVGRPPRLF